MKDTLFVHKSKDVAVALSLIIQKLRHSQVYFPVVERHHVRKVEGLTQLIDPGVVLGGVNVSDVFVQQDFEATQLTMRSFHPYFVNVNEAVFIFRVTQGSTVVEYTDKELSKVLADRDGLDIALYCIVIKEKGSFNDE